MKHKNFHPEICKLLDMFLDLENEAQLRANTITKNGLTVDCVTRAKAQATADAYAFCRMMLRSLNI